MTSGLSPNFFGLFIQEELAEMKSEMEESSFATT
jgi:hypothetical protein